MSLTCTAPEPTIARRRRLLSVGTMLFLCGLLPGIYELRHPEGYGFGRGFEMAATARSLVATGTFGNPFEPYITGPTAANPPLYPLFLAGLIRVFGKPELVVLAAVLINILLNAAIAALLPRVSRVFYDDPLPGVFAAVLWILSMRLMPQWDTTCTVAGLLFFSLLTARDVERPGSALWAGLLGGAVSLLNPSAVLVFFPWVLYLLLSRHIPRRQAFRYAAILAVTVAACNVPWVVRNYRIWHAPVLRTNFGYTLYSSNNDCAQSSLYRDAAVGCYQQTHPSGSASEARLLQDLGEYQFDRLRAADALRWIGAHPARFRELTLARIVEFWFPDPGLAPRTAYGIWAITALSIPGLFLMVRRRQSVSIYIVAVWLVYPLLYFVVVSADRYRFPLLWTSLLPAGYWAARLYSRLRMVQQ